MLPTKFQIKVKKDWPFQQTKRKTDFQDGHDGAHLGFPVGIFLTILDLQVTLILSTKFRVNWPSGVGGVGF